MDPPVTSIDAEKFAAMWKIFEEEAEKLSNGKLCNGMAIYYAIYHIVSSGVNEYTVRLHWSIGKFFISLAKQLQTSIQGAEWIKHYANAFVIFEKTVEAIDALSAHLNEAVEKNKESRRVRDLGYVIWERLILQYRIEAKLPSLHEALPDYPEHVRYVLRSLEKINTNSEDPLEYYKNNYERGIIHRASLEYRSNILPYSQNSFPLYIRACGERLYYILEKYKKLVLPVSIKVLESELEVVIFSVSIYSIQKEMLDILNRKNVKEILHLCEATMPLKKHTFTLFLECVRIFSSSQWPDKFVCSEISEKYNELVLLLAPTKCQRILDILADTLSKRINGSGAGLQLSDYLEKIIQKKRDSKLPSFAVLLRCITSQEEKNIFYSSYINKLSQRFLSLQFNPSMERMVLEYLNLPWTLFRKVKKIFDDVIKSVQENKNFQLFCPEKFSETEKDPFFYVTVTTACMWPITEEELQLVAIPGPLSEYIERFEEYYTHQYQKKKLFWSGTLSWMEIELETDKVYNIKLSVDHYGVLMHLEKEGKSMEELLSLTKLSTKTLNAAIHSLSEYSLIVKNREKYFINIYFSSVHQNIEVCSEPLETNRVGNRKPYYQAFISRYLKSIGKCDISHLEATIQDNHSKKFPWNSHEYMEAFLNLQERGLLEIEGSNAMYIP
ncbi:cullin 2 [Nematocida sp. LUAm3]|nr:cullin 2 [Nematocida sp. LUAm3]KAI5175395.1 cullin 2 [Nematocida sp. LUAm2]KAI5177648.1 cullin 2 [Nematocida sp. LUAm1]